MQSLLPQFSRYRVVLQADEPIHLPAYPGSALRGVLGHGLRRAVCVTRAPRCDGCLLLSSCAFPLFFGSTPTGDANPAPAPFVLEVDASAPRDMAAGDRYGFGLTLIGPGIAVLPYIIHGLSVAGRGGLGPTRAAFFVSEVLQEAVLGSESWTTIYRDSDGELARLVPEAVALPPMPDQLHINLRTPLRTKRAGRLIRPETFTLIDLLVAVRGRLRDLVRRYGAAGPRVEFPPLPPPDDLATTSRLRWVDWTRYSSRQRTTMQLGGVVGEITVESGFPAAWWAPLWIGQWLHAGKSASMGLGSYRLVDVASLRPAAMPEMAGIMASEKPA